MPFRLLGAPWWLRWILLSLSNAVILAVMWRFRIPDIHGTAAVVWVVGGGLACAALITAAQQRKHHAYTAALAGLNNEQRSQAVRALSRGDIPADPVVLWAAMQVAGVLAAGRTPSRGMRILRLFIVAWWPVVAVLHFVDGKITEGLGWGFIGIVLAAGWAWDWYDVRRLRIRFEMLRDAATRQKATG